jgi:hypothetical protein
MRVLRLSNSDDTAGELSPEVRAWHIAGEVLAAALGEPVETTTRVIWPEPSLPDLVDRWLDRYEPDMVFSRSTGTGTAMSQSSQAAAALAARGQATGGGRGWRHKDPLDLPHPRI